MQYEWRGKPEIEKAVGGNQFGGSSGGTRIITETGKTGLDVYVEELADMGRLVSCLYFSS